jgi:DNA-binding transcriptional LysR family regulator
VAARLGLTPSAISHALTRLRDIFDDPLFERRHDGVQPTRRALDLEPHIKSALAIVQNAISEQALDPFKLKRVFKIAALDYVMVFVGPAITRIVAKQAPHVQLSFTTLGRSEALTAVKRGEVDLSIGVFPTLTEDVELQTITYDSFVCVARKGHPALKKGMSAKIYAELDHILVSGSGELSSQVDEVMRHQGTSRRVVAAVPQFLASLATVAISDVIASVPQRLAVRYAKKLGLETHPMPIKMGSFRVTAAMSKSAASDAALQWLIGLIKAELAKS